MMERGADGVRGHAGHDDTDGEQASARPSGTLRVLDRTTLVDRATAALREDILSGALPPGTQISLSAVADSLGVSPSPIREALRMLTADGLVELSPRRGFSVRAITASDLQDTYRMRLTLDPLATRMAVLNLDQGELSRLEATHTVLQDAHAAKDLVAVRRLNREFHFQIYAAAGSPWLLRFISMLWDNCERYWVLLGHRDVEHRRIIDACAAGDAARAEELMRDHLDGTWRAVEQRMAKLQQADASSPSRGRTRASRERGKL
jgi:DNA-binding GntR family transcriptional regulator